MRSSELCIIVRWDPLLTCEQTDWQAYRTENITFPQLRWRVVITSNQVNFWQIVTCKKVKPLNSYLTAPKLCEDTWWHLATFVRYNSGITRKNRLYQETKLEPPSFNFGKMWVTITLTNLSNPPEETTFVDVGGNWNNTNTVALTHSSVDCHLSVLHL